MRPVLDSHLGDWGGSRAFFSTCLPFSFSSSCPASLSLSYPWTRPSGTTSFLPGLPLTVTAAGALPRLLLRQDGLERARRRELRWPQPWMPAWRLDSLAGGRTASCTLPAPRAGLGAPASCGAPGVLSGFSVVLKAGVHTGCFMEFSWTGKWLGCTALKQLTDQKW